MYKIIAERPNGTIKDFLSISIDASGKEKKGKVGYSEDQENRCQAAPEKRRREENPETALQGSGKKGGFNAPDRRNPGETEGYPVKYTNSGPEPLCGGHTAKPQTLDTAHPPDSPWREENQKNPARIGFRGKRKPEFIRSGAGMPTAQSRIFCQFQLTLPGRRKQEKSDTEKTKKTAVKQRRK